MHGRKIVFVLITTIAFAGALLSLSYFVPSIAANNSLMLRAVLLSFVFGLLATLLEYLKADKSHPWFSGSRFSWVKTAAIFLALFLFFFFIQVIPEVYSKAVTGLGVATIAVIIIYRNVKHLSGGEGGKH